jgi:hypothetical protein
MRLPTAPEFKQALVFGGVLLAITVVASLALKLSGLNEPVELAPLAERRISLLLAGAALLLVWAPWSRPWLVREGHPALYFVSLALGVGPSVFLTDWAITGVATYADLGLSLVYGLMLASALIWVGALQGRVEARAKVP